MSGRRRDTRYGLAVPCEGSFLFVQDVVVERLEGEAVYALGDGPEAIGIEMTLDVSGGADGADTRVRLEECTPVVVDGVMRYRLRFAII
jgi:hypothetical protein